MDSSRWLPLGLVASGRSVILRRVRAGRDLAARLAAMGMIPGTEIYVHRNDRQGPVLVGVQGARFMLGRGMVEKISVEES